mmetsp:Transcript_10937/g.12498  ORF Transcript_10937/g.12498 Transcript_10937/m.12498 type:complete len:94 (-) Transcript_10937:230-511(-)
MPSFQRASSFRTARRRALPASRHVSYTEGFDEFEIDSEYECESWKPCNRDMNRVTGDEYYSLNKKACQVLGLTEDGVSFMLKNKKKRTWRLRI